MKLIHLGGFPDEEKQGFKGFVYHNVVNAAQILIRQARNRKLELELTNEVRNSINFLLSMI